jgi:hypothetical protein
VFDCLEGIWDEISKSSAAQDASCHDKDGIASPIADSGFRPDYYTPTQLDVTNIDPPTTRLPSPSQRPLESGGIRYPPGEGSNTMECMNCTPEARPINAFTESGHERSQDAITHPCDEMNEMTEMTGIERTSNSTIGHTAHSPAPLDMTDPLQDILHIQQFGSLPPYAISLPRLPFPSQPESTSRNPRSSEPAVEGRDVQEVPPLRRRPDLQPTTANSDYSSSNDVWSGSFQDDINVLDMLNMEMWENLTSGIGGSLLS